MQAGENSCILLQPKTAVHRHLPLGNFFVLVFVFVPIEEQGRMLSRV